MSNRIENMIEMAWEWKAKYPCFELLLWDKWYPGSFWFSGEEDFGL